MSSRRTGNDYPAACFEIVPKAMRNRRCVYERGGKATLNWRVEWSVGTERSDRKLVCCQETRANV